MRKAFTLIEVNLAMLIMAGGILSIVGLYAFGYRENRQSREDVAATAVADAVISPLMMAITATNLKWSAFRDAFHFPDETGWGAYFDNDGIVSQNPDGKARSAFSQAMSKMQGAAKGTFDCQTAFPSAALESSGLMCGLVVLHDKDSPIVRIGFRATSQPGTLLAMPLFYTEARFQGLANE
jgi:type II secretory pathway pseudopilin PulG